MWTRQQVDEHNRRIAAAEAAARGYLSDAQPEPDKAPALERPAPRTTSSLGKVTVSFTGRRCRLLDPDNFAASCKDLLDGLVHAGLIPDDAPDHIRLTTQQEKVSGEGQEMTIIEIEWPK